MTFVQEIAPGEFRPWKGGRLVKTCRMATTVTRYEDGREEQAEIEVEPYEAEIAVASVAGWSAAELAACKLFEPVRFVASEGKRATGAPRYERRGDFVHEVFDEEDIPPPPPPPTKTELLDRLLADYGLTREDLKEAVTGSGALA